MHLLTAPKQNEDPKIHVVCNVDSFVNNYIFSKMKIVLQKKQITKNERQNIIKPKNQIKIMTKTLSNLKL
jgi:hypothetical protein